MQRSKPFYLAAQIFGCISILSTVLALVSSGVINNKVFIAPPADPAPISRTAEKSKKPPKADKPQKNKPAKPLDWRDWLLIGVSVVTTIGTVSSMLLGWRADRRQSKEQAIISQLQRELEVERAKTR